jgi:hypothetical protein
VVCIVQPSRNVVVHGGANGRITDRETDEWSE